MSVKQLIKTPWCQNMFVFTTTYVNLESVIAKRVVQLPVQGLFVQQHHSEGGAVWLEQVPWRPGVSGCGQEGNVFVLGF